MDEVRVWVTARTQEQIRANMFARLTGREAGLAGLWNFDADDANDATPNGLDGILADGATTVSATVPQSFTELALPTLLSGRLTDEAGRPLSRAVVQLKQGAHMTRSVYSNIEGLYRVAYHGSNAPVTLLATANTLGAWRTNLLLASGETNLDLTLRDATQLSGKVLALDDSPLPNVVVQAVPESGSIDAELVDGLHGEYFQMSGNPEQFPEMAADRKPDFTRLDRTVNLGYQSDAIPLWGTPLQGMVFIRWTGRLQVHRAAAVTFHLQVDDNLRLFIDGTLIAEGGGGYKSVGSELAAGEHAIRLEYYNAGGGGAQCQLEWSSEAMSRHRFPLIKPSLITTATDEKDEYRFRHLPPGRYQVRAHVPGGFLYPTHSAAAKVGTPGSPDNGVKGPPSPDAAIFPIAYHSKFTGVNFKTAPFKKGVWKTYTKADGLPHEQVFRVIETKDGMMWLGTLGNGAVRWDGRRFTSLTKADGLANDFVTAICETRDGALWFGTDAGASRWDGSRFTTFTAKDGLATNDVNAITQGGDGAVWFTSDAGATRWDGRQFKAYGTNDGPAAILRGDTLTDRKGQVWLCGLGTLSRWDGTNFHTLTVSDGLPNAYIWSLHEDRKGQIWAGMSRDGVACWDGKRIRTFTTADGLADNSVLAIHEDRDGMMWFGTWSGGVSRFDGTSFVNYSVADGLPENRVHSITQDDNGVLWFGTFKSGLMRFDEHRLVRYSTADGLAHDSCSSVIADQRTNLWFTTQGGGVSRWNGRGFASFSTADGLADNTVKCALAANDGTLWFGTARGLSRWDGSRFENFDSAHGLAGNDVRALCQDRFGLIWAGTSGGLSRWDGKRFERFTTAQGLVDNDITVISQDKAGALWIGTGYKGLSRWDGRRFNTLTEAEGLSSGTIQALWPAGDGGIWLGFGIGGVAHVLATNVTTYTPASGLAASYALAAYEDRDGVAWFGHDDELSLFDGVGWSTIRLEKPPGFRDRFKINGILQAGDGPVWLATSAGAYRMEKTRPPARRPLVQVRGGQQFTEPGTVPLSSTGSRLTFNTSYTDRRTPPEKQQFRYAVLRGAVTADQLAKTARWSAPTRETQLDFATNAPGRYTFAVQYIDQDLGYSPPALTAFTLVLPWYRNPVFVAPGSLGGIALIGWAFVARVLVLRRKREAEELRERLLEEEHRAREAAEDAREAAERARIEIEAKNEQLAAAKRAADEANQAKSSFLANMSHELRTPMNAIIGYSEMLREEAEDLDQRSFIPDLQKIHGAGKHLLGLINDILDLSKVEAGKMTLYVEEFEVAQLVREVEATVEPLVAKNSNTLVVTCPADIGRMRADLTKVRQVLFNLLSNAAKFTRNGVIRLEATRSAAGTHLVFQVSDSGIGMTAEQVGRLFQAFEQADKSTSKQFGGTGLGLALSRKFCQLMGGEITVNSTLGQGSAFTVTLPIEVADAPLQSASVPPPARPNGPLILVIDDDPNVRDLLGRNLRKHGYRVEVAADGASGLKMAGSLQPEAITLDVMMPGMDGWTVLNRLKTDPATAGIPVIMVSMLDQVNLGVSLGAVDLLTKPVDWPQLERLLEKYAQPSRGAGILLVEDDPGTREMMRRQLEKAGWPVTEAVHGKMALECLRQTTPALIVLDLMMPEMDGFDFLDELRRQPQGRTIPVIVVTAMELSGLDRERLNGQVLKILKKASVSAEEITEQIRAAIGPGCPTPKTSAK